MNHSFSKSPFQIFVMGWFMELIPRAGENFHFDIFGLFWDSFFFSKLFLQLWTIADTYLIRYSNDIHSWYKAYTHIYSLEKLA
jgi:hypothetical protein